MEIDIEKFYKVGIVCFGVITLMSIIMFIQNLHIVPIFQSISTGFQTIFTTALTLFFYSNYKKAKTTINTSDPEINDILKQAKNGGLNNNNNRIGRSRNLNNSKSNLG